jgi:hypothetical protein
VQFFSQPQHTVPSTASPLTFLGAKAGLESVVAAIERSPPGELNVSETVTAESLCAGVFASAAGQHEQRHGGDTHGAPNVKLVAIALGATQKRHVVDDRMAATVAIAEHYATAFSARAYR